ncbi:chemotaxis protein CheW [Chloroflexota bacterium]
MAEQLISHNYLTFRVGHEWYGVDIDDVVEVTHLVTVTELPATTPDLLGLMTVREEVMPVIDLRLRFGLLAGPLHLDTPIICVRTVNGPIALVADEAEDVVRYAESQLADYDGLGSRYVNGAVRQGDRLLLLVDIAKLRAEVIMPEQDDYLEVFAQKKIAEERARVAALEAVENGKDVAEEPAS